MRRVNLQLGRPRKWSSPTRSRASRASKVAGAFTCGGYPSGARSPASAVVAAAEPGDQPSAKYLHTISTSASTSACSICAGFLRGGVACGMIGEPVDDGGHVLLEIARVGEVEHAGSRRGAI